MNFIIGTARPVKFFRATPIRAGPEDAEHNFVLGDCPETVSGKKLVLT
jgi:hypothetical protein